MNDVKRSHARFASKRALRGRVFSKSRPSRVTKRWRQRFAKRWGSVRRRRMAFPPVFVSAGSAALRKVRGTKNGPSPATTTARHTARAARPNSCLTNSARGGNRRAGSIAAAAAQALGLRPEGETIGHKLRPLAARPIKRRRRRWSRPPRDTKPRGATASSVPGVCRTSPRPAKEKRTEVMRSVRTSRHPEALRE